MKVEMTTESGDLRVETTDSQMGHWLQLTRLGKEAATQWTHVMFHVWPHLPPFSFLVKLQKNMSGHCKRDYCPTSVWHLQ